MHFLYILFSLATGPHAREFANHPGAGRQAYPGCDGAFRAGAR